LMTDTGPVRSNVPPVTLYYPNYGPVHATVRPGIPARDYRTQQICGLPEEKGSRPRL
jgi:hypothetical protein